MQKNMLIVGNTNFMDNEYQNGKIIINKNKKAFDLSKMFNVDNFSKRYLTIEESLKYVKTFTSKKKYSYAIISLGEGDLHLKTKIEEFKNNFEEIIIRLAKKNIRIILLKPNLENLKSEEELKFNDELLEIYDKYSKDFTFYNDEYEDNVFKSYDQSLLNICK